MATTKYNPLVLKALREEGWHAASVDHWDSFTRRTKDLYSCIDVLGVGPEGTIAIQVTSRSNMSSRRKKVLAADAYPSMLAAGWFVEIWGVDQPKGKHTAMRVKRERLTE